MRHIHFGKPALTKDPCICEKNCPKIFSADKETDSAFKKYILHLILKSFIRSLISTTDASIPYEPHMGILCCLAVDKEGEDLPYDADKIHVLSRSDVTYQ